LRPFTQKRWELLAAEFDHALPNFGFAKGDWLPLFTVVRPFLSVATGDERVKGRWKELLKLMFLDKAHHVIPPFPSI